MFRACACRGLILGVVVLCFMHSPALAYVDHGAVSSELMNADDLKGGEDGEDLDAPGTAELSADLEDLDSVHEEGYNEIADAYGGGEHAPKLVDIEEPDLNPEQMQVLHTKIDADADGKISTAEFIAFWKAREIAIDLKHLDPVFSSVDQDGDGKASMEEVLAKLGGIESKFAELTPETDEQKVEETELKKAKFKASDLDGDGYLNKMELFELGRSGREKTSLQALDVAHYVKRKDQNHDGQLDAEEFYKITHLTKDEQEKDFKKLDVDGNGKLSADEIGHWHTGVFTFSKIVAELFQIADNDADSYISLDELRSSLPKLHGSDAASHMHSWATDEL